MDYREISGLAEQLRVGTAANENDQAMLASIIDAYR